MNPICFTKHLMCRLSMYTYIYIYLDHYTVECASKGCNIGKSRCRYLHDLMDDFTWTCRRGSYREPRSVYIALAGHVGPEGLDPQLSNYFSIFQSLRVTFTLAFT